MEVLVLDGKNYVKASKAARELGYAPDYVGQLCRGGHVDAHLIGRTWYVNQEELSTHRVEKKRMSRIKAREHAKRSIEEHRLKVTETRNNYKNIDIRYETDSEELMPEVRKVHIEAETPTHASVEKEKIETETEIVNEGEKVAMSGEVPVIDVTDEAVNDGSTVVLMPTKERKPKKEGNYGKGRDINTKHKAQKPNFIEKLSLIEKETPENIQTKEQSSQKTKKLRPSISLCITTVLLICVVVLASLPLTFMLHYAAGTDNTISYTFSLDETIAILNQKI